MSPRPTAASPVSSVMARTRTFHHFEPSFYRVVLGDKKVHAIGQHVDDARAVPLAAAKKIPKLIAFDLLHGILRPLSSDAVHAGGPYVGGCKSP
jgi:hypothetical protein